MILSGFGMICLGQTAKLNPDNCIIEFTFVEPVISIELRNPLGGKAQTYIRGDYRQNLQFSPAGAGGLTSEKQRFKIYGNSASGTRCNMLVNGTVVEIPTDLEKTPLRLIVEFQPDANDANSRDITVLTVKPVSKTLQIIKLPRTEADGREDAEFYVSGESITAIGKSPKFSADIKIEREFGKKGVPFLFTPFFELKWSNTQEDSDKLGFGIKFSNSFKFADSDKGVREDSELREILDNARTGGEEQTPKFTKINKRRTQAQYFLWEGTGEIESSWNFRVTNFITSQEIKYLLRPKIFRDKDDAPRGKLLLTPFIGTDLGWNLKSPVLRDERRIVRLKAGATLNLNINKPFGESYIQGITWENSFIQRWFVLKEQAYDKDDDGNLILRDYGRKPRSYFSSDLQFKLSDYLGFGLKYEWGQLPPLYEKVNHRLKVGFTYSFKRKALL